MKTKLWGIVIGGVLASGLFISSGQSSDRRQQGVGGHHPVALCAHQRDPRVDQCGKSAQVPVALRAPVYDSNVHYHQVRDTWAGVRTPDGR